MQQRVDKLKEQRAPRRMQDISGSAKDSIQDEDQKKKKSRAPALLRIATAVDGDDAGCTRGLKPMPSFVEQGPYESEEQFVNRLSRISAQAVAEATLEQRFGLDFCPAVQPQMLSTRSGEVVASGVKKRKRKGMTAEARAEARRVKRRERDAKRRSKKKRGSKSGPDDGFEQFQDDIQFGDIVKAPPAFSKRRARM